MSDPAAKASQVNAGGGTGRRRVISFAVLFARPTLGLVFSWNVLCAVEFILRPALYAPAFELSGATGRAAVQGFGVLFLMWNATYPPVLLQPRRQRTLFRVILAQQAIGLMGESWIWLQLPTQHSVARSAILRFIAFDGAGLLLLAAVYLALFLFQRKGYAGNEPESRPAS